MDEKSNSVSGWRKVLRRDKNDGKNAGPTVEPPDVDADAAGKPTRWTMGILNDKETEEVPGSVLLLSKVSEYNEPLGLQNRPARTSASSLPSWKRPLPPSRRSSSTSRWRLPQKKRTADGKIILEPQPDDSLNDPLNWKIWRRDAALLSLGFYCMLGGGMTTVIAAGFGDVAADYNVSVPQVALTTGLYMLGLGLGSVVLSPTAILFGKRPVYLVAATCFVLSAVWCALSPNFPSLICARIFMGFAASSVECLPSASIAEIYFLHEKAYRLGIYTLLLLGGKNLVPLVSAAIIQSLGWRWVFWVVAIVVGFAGCLLFFFVPETFWDRTPVPPKRHPRKRPSFIRAFSMPHRPTGAITPIADVATTDQGAPRLRRAVSHTLDGEHLRHARFAVESSDEEKDAKESQDGHSALVDPSPPRTAPTHPGGGTPTDYFNLAVPANTLRADQSSMVLSPDSPLPPITDLEKNEPEDGPNAYTRHFQSQPPKTWAQQLVPWSGRLSRDNWFRVALRPFILFAYPSILWSALVYALSVGWLIVLSESVSTIYEQRDSYNFTSLQTGLVYISPFIAGVLGTAVAGKCSDFLVRYLARRNGGLYEPEFRLFMGIPIAIFTTIGLMGYGWAAQERDAWIVPTVFFGFVSFGCCVGSTTAITFAVDSYRQYAGEALVTLNFSKNILHGLVFSLFFNDWLESEGSKDVFIAIGGIQLACLLTTIPMYIYGKRARMWTVRKNLMEKF